MRLSILTLAAVAITTPFTTARTTTQNSDDDDDDATPAADPAAATTATNRPTTTAHTTTRTKDGKSSCPTVTSTRTLCTTCVVPLCLGLATLTQSCGCSTAETVYLDFPCSGGCSQVGCSTSYAVVTASQGCATTTTSSTTSTGTTGAVRNGVGRMEVPRWFAGW
ncbi:hypothetical protein B0T25DRAFT_550454 [Lasiosphaeria hispida]|uniref:Extracellular membrane protein CFEM domain-containing protein n=1 Tax=Lasiosphaeria hispida TaxID=260671 RepID=A0AAJ0HAU8_9PEZI|nr:hypothetical protein B0T25DRAFT_550454 [Lasiosphaeria hispida]